MDDYTIENPHFPHNLFNVGSLKAFNAQVKILNDTLSLYSWK